MQNAGLINGFRRMWESKTGSCSHLQFPFSLAWAKKSSTVKARYSEPSVPTYLQPFSFTITNSQKRKISL
ncbi:unnamed protein product [Rhizophagus irregularis]|nr:unnamed protein product [Rhizophagus irregularis]CAB5201666.1 unnamed protein product [Rhizophagus irregularis]